MKSFKILIAYDGTDFFGWQQQSNHITVSGVIKKRFESIFKTKIKMIGASRTDSGVHALGQVATIKTDLDLDLTAIIDSLNRSLPKSILIRKIKPVEKGFHPCCNVDHKVYYYHLFLKRPLPFVSRYGWYYRFIDFVDLNKFQNALDIYVGEHDFASFCKLDDKKKSTVKTIDKIYVKRIDDLGAIRVVVVGNSFLRFQIRRMIGYALDVARRSDLSIDYLRNILNKPDHRQTLLKVDGSGLCLRKVVYKNGFNF